MTAKNMKRSLFALLGVALLVAAMFIPHTHGLVSLALVMPFASRFSKGAKAQAQKMFDLDVEFISLVDVPANDLPIIMKNADGMTATTKFDMQIVRKDVTQGLIYATVYQPDSVDLQKDFTDAQEIQKAAHKFMEKSRQANVDVQHNLTKGAGTVVESFILKGANDNYPAIKEGAWCVVIKLSDAMKPLANQINGVSMYGKCNYNKSASGAEVIEKGNGTWLKLMRTAEDAVQIGDTDMAKILGVSLGDYSSIENGDSDFQFTAEILNTISKKLKLPVEAVFSAALNNTPPVPASSAGANPGNAGGTPPASGGAGAPAKSFNNGELHSQIRQQKNMIKSATIPVPGLGTAGVVLDAAAELPVRKSQFFSTLAKRATAPADALQKDLIGDGVMDIGGTVGVELSTTLIDLSMEASPLMKNVQIVQMDQLKQDVPIFSITGNNAIRVTTRGTMPAEAKLTDANTLTRTLSANDVDFLYNIPDSLLRNYRNRFANFEGTLGGAMVNNFTDSTTAIAMYGSTDTYDGTDPLTLGIGWLKIGRDGATGGQAWRLIDYSTEGFTDITEAWDLAISNMATNSKKYAKNTTAFIISTKDFEDYESVLIGHPGGFQVIVEGAKGTYRGHPVFVETALNAGDWIYTPMKNLVLGIVTDGVDGVRTTTHQMLKSRDFLMTTAVDFDLVDPLGFISGKP